MLDICGCSPSAPGPGESTRASKPPSASRSPREAAPPAVDCQTVYHSVPSSKRPSKENTIRNTVNALVTLFNRSRNALADIAGPHVA